MTVRANKVLLGALALTGVLALTTAPPTAASVPGTATISAGTLTYVTPTAVNFAATLNGTNQDITANQNLDVRDNTGSGTGWNITLTSTTFTAGANTLPTNATTDLSATGACNPGITCTLADNSTTVYPVSIPAGTSAPTAVRIQTAATGTGLSAQTWSHTMNLRVPANTSTGTYLSTWTYSLVSGP